MRLLCCHIAFDVLIPLDFAEERNIGVDDVSA